MLNHSTNTDTNDRSNNEINIIILLLFISGYNPGTCTKHSIRLTAISEAASSIEEYLTS